MKTLLPDRIGGRLRNVHAQTEAEHLRCPEHFRTCGNMYTYHILIRLIAIKKTLSSPRTHSYPLGCGLGPTCITI